MLKKASTLIMSITIISIGYMYKEYFLQLLEKGGILSLLVGMLLVAICVFFPIIPFAVLAGMIGALFGIVQGVLICITGSLIGTIIMFIFSRYGFRENARIKLQKYPKIRKYEEILEGNFFLSILFLRIIPIIPSPVVNILCGLSGVRLLVFITASALGKFPNILILTFAGSTIVENKWVSVSTFTIYFFLIFVLTFIFIYRRMSKRGVESIVEEG